MQNVERVWLFGIENMQKFTVTKKEAGWRFDKYLKKLLPQAGSGFLYKMLRKKNITLNGKKAEGNEAVAAGDSVELFFSEETFQKFAGSPSAGNEFAEKAGKRMLPEGKEPDISVIYEDEDILILNKPTGVLSQKAEKGDVSLNEWMLKYLFQKGEFAEEAGCFCPSVCNRLDRNTSGLVLCGKSVRGSQFLSEALRNRSLRKYYTAYVRGEIAEEASLVGYFRKEEEKNRAQILSEEEYRRLVLARPEAEREYKKVETVIRPLFYAKPQTEEKSRSGGAGDYTKLEVLLVTGKSHQIRAQLAAVGHPVLGDRKYGWKPRGKWEEKWKSQLLHAGRIEFSKIEGEFARLSGKCFEAPALFENSRKDLI